MKTFFTLLLLLGINYFLYSQSPEKISFQAVIRNASNALVSNQSVGVKLSILQGSGMSEVYVETHNPTSNSNGLITLEIGGGSVVSGDFSTIDWGNGPFYIKTETDVLGGTNYTLSSTTQFLSVPYALYSKTSGSSTPGPQGPAGNNGSNMLNLTSIESAGSNCASGGVKIEFGLDANNNTILDASEINAALTQYVCNGTNGINGTNGADGTDGTDGTNGINGTNGLNMLSMSTSESAGANCANGGVKIQFGLDANNNTILDAGEINAALTQYVCNGTNGINGTNGTNGAAGANGINGTNGTNGLNMLSLSTSETAGANCANGGVKIEFGLDANNNTILDAGEINATLTQYVCNGATGPAGPAGSSTGGFTHYIGESFGGGVIYDLWKDGSGVEHGLIISLTDLSNSSSWSNVTSTLIGTSAQSSFDGLSNSNTIIGQAGHTSSAAKLCLDATTNGQSDWYLPSIIELGALRTNYVAVSATIASIPGATQLINGSYWSSTENTLSTALLFSFHQGILDTGNAAKNKNNSVRAIRKF